MNSIFLTIEATRIIQALRKNQGHENDVLPRELRNRLKHLTWGGDILSLCTPQEVKLLAEAFFRLADLEAPRDFTGVSDWDLCVRLHKIPEQAN